MGKRLANEDIEMDTIKNHLDRQDKTLNEILIVLRGSVSLGVEGMLNNMRELERSNTQIVSDIAHLQRWKKMVQENQGKVTVSWREAAKTLFSVIGIAGTIVGMFLAIKQIFDAS